MPAESQTSASAIGGRFQSLGFRTRVLLVLLLAGVPGAIFGAAEASRAFHVALAQRVDAARSVQSREASDLDGAVTGAMHVLAALGSLPSLSGGAQACRQTLYAAVRNVDRYAGAARIGANGATVCATNGLRLDGVAEADWFEDLRRGGKNSAASVLVPSGERAVVVATALTSNGRFDGALIVSLRREWLSSMLREDFGGRVASAMILDSDGNVLAAAVSNGDVGSARAALPGPDSLESWHGNGAFRLVVTPSQAPGNPLGRALLVAAAPIIVILLTSLVVGVALEVWVMRWFRRLHAHVERGVDDPPSRMDGAPPELRALGAAFNRTMAHAHARQEELAGAVLSNKALTRDLHHRVKNNLQILVSLLSRQYKRAPNEASRQAVVETRCRVLAIALVHRFIDPPEHLGVIDLAGYLSELSRQTHAAYFGEGRRARLLMEIEAAEASTSRATAIGLMLVETLIAGAKAAQGDTSLLVRWRESDRGDELFVEVRSVGGPAAEVDIELIRQTARQAGGIADVGPGARVSAHFDRSPIVRRTVASGS
jgi:two-component sensor histidine kinase